MKVFEKGPFTGSCVDESGNSLPFLDRDSYPFFGSQLFERKGLLPRWNLHFSNGSCAQFFSAEIDICPGLRVDCHEPCSRCCSLSRFAESDGFLPLCLSQLQGTGRCGEAALRDDDLHSISDKHSFQKPFSSNSSRGSPLTVTLRIRWVDTEGPRGFDSGTLLPGITTTCSFRRTRNDAKWLSVVSIRNREISSPTTTLDKVTRPLFQVPWLPTRTFTSAGASIVMVTSSAFSPLFICRRNRQGHRVRTGPERHGLCRRLPPSKRAWTTTLSPALPINSRLSRPRY